MLWGELVSRFSEILLAVLLFLPSLIHAAGLGDIQLYSSLYEPFDADVQLVDLDGIPQENIQAQLGSPEAFGLHGLKWEDYLADLHFKVAQNDEGQSVVRITGDKPVNAPVMTFFIELMAGSEHLSRQYTVLLDPADYGQPEQKTPAAKGIEKHYGPVTAQDTLWHVAIQYPHKKITPQQEMLAIYRANPKAFAYDNVNGLKTGFMLTIPSAGSAKAIAYEDANRTLKEQKQQWLHRSQKPTVAVKPKKIDVPPMSNEAVLFPTLALESGERSGSVGALSAELAVTVEQLSVLERDQEQLHLQVSQLEKENVLLKQALERRQQEIFTLEKLLVQQQPEQLATQEKQRKVIASIDQYKPVPIEDHFGWYNLLFGFLGVSLGGGYAYHRYRRVQIARNTDDEADLEHTIEISEEADMLLAYGRYKKAETLLSGALREQPGQPILVVKLLETYVLMKDQKAFKQLLKQLPWDFKRKERVLFTKVEKLKQTIWQATVEEPDLLEDDSRLDDDDYETSLDLARAYIDMGNIEEAEDLLSMIIDEGDESIKEEAQRLLEKGQNSAKKRS